MVATNGDGKGAMIVENSDTVKLCCIKIRRLLLTRTQLILQLPASAKVIVTQSS